MSLTNCRFYEEKYPEIDSFVMVNVGASAPLVLATLANIEKGQASMFALVRQTQQNVYIFLDCRDGRLR